MLHECALNFFKLYTFFKKIITRVAVYYDNIIYEINVACLFIYTVTYYYRNLRSFLLNIRMAFPD